MNHIMTRQSLNNIKYSTNQYNNNPNKKQKHIFNNVKVSKYMSQTYITVFMTDSVGFIKNNLNTIISGYKIPTYLYVIDKNKNLNGLLLMKKLLISSDKLLIADIMQSNFFFVSPNQLRTEVFYLLNNYDTDSIPVVEFGKLKGVLHDKDITKLIEDENTKNTKYKNITVPLKISYLLTSPFILWRKRVIWLLMLFIAEAYTGTVLKTFSNQLESAISLSFFIPLLIGTGGNNGTQISSTLIQAITFGEISLKNLGTVLKKELSTSFLIALTIGLIGLCRAWILNVGYKVTIIVGLTMMAIIIWSAIIASIIPIILKHMKIDPVIVSSPCINTLIDGTGLIIYFKIAEIIMINS